MPDILFNLIIFIIITDFVFSYILEYLNYSSWPSKIPETIRDFYSDQKYSEAFYYNQDKYFLSSVSSTFSYIILLGMLYAGGFYYVDEAAGVISNHPITSAILFFIILYAGNEILTLPISYYNTFVIESKYGFNRTKAPLFIKDKIVSFLISSVIISAVISILIFFYEMLGEKSWIISWIIFTVFILLIQYFYTGLIVPLFNKLTPLEEGQLKKKIEEYALKVNFPLDKIFVMDASKRSTKANAFFSGFGKRKTIVLHDTLLNNHSDDEILSVIAHETGHYKKKHIIKMLAFSSATSGIMLYLLFQFLESPHPSTIIGIESKTYHASILVFGILFGPISFIFQTIANKFSRTYEFEADEYAKLTTDGKTLSNALKKFSIEHLSNLTPHKLYVFFHYSHPPTIERIYKLEGTNK